MKRGWITLAVVLLVTTLVGGEDAQARWVSPDPLLVQDPVASVRRPMDGANPYNYVSNNPINLVDPAGLMPDAATIRNDFATEHPGPVSMAPGSPEEGTFQNVMGVGTGALVVAPVIVVGVEAAGPAVAAAYAGVGTRFYLMWDRVKDAVSTRLVGLVERITGPRLLDSQRRNIETVGNILKDHAKPGDFQGVTKELAGETIRRPDGTPYNHVKEMQDSVRGLSRAIGALRGSLDNPSHSQAVRDTVQSVIDRAQPVLQRMRDTLSGGGS